MSRGSTLGIFALIIFYRNYFLQSYDRTPSLQESRSARDASRVPDKYSKTSLHHKHVVNLFGINAFHNSQIMKNIVSSFNMTLYVDKKA